MGDDGEEQTIRDLYHDLVEAQRAADVSQRRRPMVDLGEMVDC